MKRRRFTIIPSIVPHRTSRALSRLAYSLAVVLYLGGCTPNLVQHGNLVTQEKQDQLQPGTTTQEEVITLMGPPSSRGLFDPSTWYYVGMAGEQLAFFKPEIEQETILRLTFDKQGILQKIKNFKPEDKEEVEPCPRVTPSSGHDMTILEQVFGNFGRRYQQEKK